MKFSKICSFAVALGLTAGAAALPAPASAAPILNVSGSTLMGAQGVSVGAQLYDVQFIDGTCASVFGVCDQAHFQFTTQANAATASQALLDQVFLDTGLGNFDSLPGLTNGCSLAIPTTTCQAWTPYSASGGLFSVEFAINQSGPDSIANFVNLSTNSDLSLSINDVFAVWTPSRVPEPITISLFGTGLAGAVAMRRRKKRAA